MQKEEEQAKQSAEEDYQTLQKPFLESVSSDDPINQADIDLLEGKDTPYEHAKLGIKFDPDRARMTKNSDIGPDLHHNCNEFIISLQSHIAQLRAEKEEYKRLLFEKIGLTSKESGLVLDKKTQIPLRATKLFSQKRAELEKKYSVDKKAPETDPSTAKSQGTVTE